MAPVQNVVLVAIPAAHSAVVHPCVLPETTSKQIVDDLLSGLRDQLRRKQFADIYKETHDQLQAFLRHFFKSEQDVQEILSDVYIALLEEKSGKQHLGRVAKQKAIDRQRRIAIETQTFTSLDGRRSRQNSQSDGDGGEETTAMASDFTSPNAGDRDPLEILMHKEELESGIKMAMTDRKHRGIRECQWFKDLLDFAECRKVVLETAS